MLLMVVGVKITIVVCVTVLIIVFLLIILDRKKKFEHEQLLKSIAVAESLKLRELYISIRRLLCQDSSPKVFNYDDMSGGEFEDFCCKLLSGNGFYHVEATKASGDFGIDILCEKANVKFAVQCKCYTGKVGVSAIQQAESGCKYYGYDCPIVMTNAYFTKAAKELAAHNGVTLIDRDSLNAMIRVKYGGKSYDDAYLIVGAYCRLFREGFHCNVSVKHFWSHLEVLKLEMSLVGDLDPIRQRIGEMNIRIGFRHTLENRASQMILLIDNKEVSNVRSK